MIRPIRAIALEARFDATPAQVWHALTDAQALANWFAPQAKADQHERGIVEVAWGADTWPSTLGGWKYFLWNLGLCVTRHLGTPRVMVSSRRRSPVPRSALWDSFFSSALIATPANDSNECTLTLGDTAYGGVVQTSEAPFRFAARFPSLADALLFIELEGAKPANFNVGFWLSTYGVDATTVSELQRSLDEAVARLVEPGVAATL